MTGFSASWIFGVWGGGLKFKIKRGAFTLCSRLARRAAGHAHTESSITMPYQMLMGEIQLPGITSGDR